MALDDNPRNTAGYDQPELRLVRDWGAEGAADGEREVLPGVSVVPTGGHTGGHQGVVVRGRDRTVAFFGDLAMRPWSANPRWVTAFDDHPLDSVLVKVSLFGRAADEGWTVVLSHEARVPDRTAGARPRPLPLGPALAGPPRGPHRLAGPAVTAWRRASSPPSARHRDPCRRPPVRGATR